MAGLAPAISIQVARPLSPSPGSPGH